MTLTEPKPIRLKFDTEYFCSINNGPEFNLRDLLRTILDVYDAHADDLCWMDVDKIFAACGLAVPDRRVGDKIAMLANCARFIDSYCKDGGWPTYVELEAELAQYKRQCAALAERVAAQSELLSQKAEVKSG